MAFIERIFGLSPDGSSLAFKIFLVALPLVLIASVWYGRRKQPPRR